MLCLTLNKDYKMCCSGGIVLSFFCTYWNDDSQNVITASIATDATHMSFVGTQENETTGEYPEKGDSECVNVSPGAPVVWPKAFQAEARPFKPWLTTLRIFKLMCAIIFESHKLYDKEKHREESCANLWSNSVAWGVPIPYWAREGSPLVLKSLHPVWGRSHYLLNTSMFYSF